MIKKIPFGVKPLKNIIMGNTTARGVKPMMNLGCSKFTTVVFHCKAMETYKGLGDKFDYKQIQFPYKRK